MPKPQTAPVRYAVVGLGYFAQIAVLPGFAHSRGSRLEALVSDDPVKRKRLAKKYGAAATFGYDEYDACLGRVDAVYIALPNDLHREYAIRALERGIHVLCEKPMGVTAKDCRAMLRAAGKGGARLMVGYRLHLDPANLTAIEWIRAGKIGTPRLFHSVFSMQVASDNIRTDRERGGGAVYDIGIYCLNAARYLFRAEPEEVTAFSASSGDPRFREVDEMTSAVMRFPGNRLASFTCSFGASDSGDYQVAGTKGTLCLENAYEYAEKRTLTLKTGEKEKREVFPRTDQVGAELEYFSQCVRRGKNPEPSGAEGLADVRAIEALYRSARTGRSVKLAPFKKSRRPTRAQEIRLPPVKKPRLFRTKPASQ